MYTHITCKHQRLRQAKQLHTSYVHGHVYMYVYSQVLCISHFVCIIMCIYMYVCVCIYIYIYMYYICICMYMYIHIHTYTLYIYTICTFSSSPFFLSPCHFPSSTVVQESLCTSDEPYHNHKNHLKGGTAEE